MINDTFLKVCAAAVAVSFVTIAIVQIMSYSALLALQGPREVKVVESVPVMIRGGTVHVY